MLDPEFTDILLHSKSEMQKETTENKWWFICGETISSRILHGNFFCPSQSYKSVVKKKKKSISLSRYQKAGRIDYEACETKMDFPVCVQAVLPKPKG